MAQGKQKASKDNKLKTPFCFPPHLQLLKLLLQFISLWKQLFTAAHGKYLASKQEEKLERMIINGFCQKNSQGKVFHSLGHKLVDLSLQQRRRHVLDCLPARENSTAALPTAATQAGNTQHPCTSYL